VLLWSSARCSAPRPRPKSAGHLGIPSGPVPRSALTFGLDGKVAQIFGSLVLQTGARTSKIVPYGTIGVGMMYAKFDPRQAIKEELEALGIVIEEDTELAPGIALGIGVKYYLREGMAMKGDFRNYWMWRSIQGGFNEHLYTLRRVAGGIVWEF